MRVVASLGGLPGHWHGIARFGRHSRAKKSQRAGKVESLARLLVEYRLVGALDEPKKAEFRAGLAMRLNADQGPTGNSPVGHDTDRN